MFVLITCADLNQENAHVVLMSASIIVKMIFRNCVLCNYAYTNHFLYSFYAISCQYKDI